MVTKAPAERIVEHVVRQDAESLATLLELLALVATMQAGRAGGSARRSRQHARHLRRSAARLRALARQRSIRQVMKAILRELRHAETVAQYLQYHRGTVAQPRRHWLIGLFFRRSAHTKAVDSPASGSSGSSAAQYAALLAEINAKRCELERAWSRPLAGG